MSDAYIDAGASMFAIHERPWAGEHIGNKNGTEKPNDFPIP